MKLRIFLIAWAVCLMLSACGGAEPTPETSTVALETITEAPETAAATTAETTVVTEEAYTVEVTTEPTATTENRYHTEGWDWWSDYVYMENKQPKY